MDNSNGIIRINKIFDYIETALCSGEEVDIDKISQILCENKLSADRIFRFLTGYTITEYVKNRKMSMAGMDIYANQEKVIDVSVKYGYSSSQAFSRAFKKFFGFVPSKMKNQQVELKLFVPFVHIDELDAVELRYMIVEKNEFCLHSINVLAGDRKELVGSVASDFWKQFDKSKISGQRYGMSQPTKKGYFYHIASDVAFEDSKPFIVKKSKWAVFTIQGDQHTVQQNVLKIDNFWENGSGLKRDMSLPVIEKYLPDRLEVYYPILCIRKI